MRFLEDGADIPNDLIRAVTEGSAVFLCGAGVSMRVRMPSFKGLAEQVYQKLGEVYTSEPAERRAFERGEYDRALRSLEKRTHQPGTPSRVRVAVAELLYAAPGIRAPDHLALLQLSRDGEGRPKLLTTNFDTLFERAAQAASLSAPSHAGKAIPKPGGARDYGVLHLHGRLGDTILGLPETDLILTSADFGDAYLRDGWVSLPKTRFVRIDDESPRTIGCAVRAAVHY
jgi:NAD-dependent SIR2 family protein deacetylase